MQRRVMATVLTAFLLSGFPTSAQPQPQGIVVNPTPAALEVEVWPGKATYLAGERLTLNVRLNETAYVYVYGINARGQITVLFPNAYTPDNRLQAGLHTLPGNRYSLLIEGPPGRELIQAIATFVPLDLFSLAEGEPSLQAPFAALGDEPEQIAARVQSLLAQTVAQDQWASAWTQFQIITATAHRWVVRSFPRNAELYVDGEFVGLTPEEITLLPPSRAGQSRKIELALRQNDQLLWSGVLKMTVDLNGKLNVQTLSENDNAAISTRRRGETTFLDVRFQSAQPSLGELNAASQTPPTSFRRIDSIGGSLSVNLGGHPQGMSSFGVELGLGSLRLGLGLADTVDAVPEFFDVGAPIDLGAKIIYNEEPEVEFYAKLVLNTGFAGLFLEIGGGVVIQVQAHVAAPSFSTAAPLDVGVLPNGYRSETIQGAGIAGLAYRANGLLLQVGYDSHRGIVGGLGVAF